MDYLLKATGASGQVRVYISRSSEIVKEAVRIHDTSLTATVALGRMLTGASLMGAMLAEEDQLVTLTLKGNGPLQGIVSTADGGGNVKGYVFEPAADVPLKANGVIDVASGVGFGTLSIIRDTGAAEPYVGQVDLMSGEIAEDLAFYFTQSEQIPTAVSLGVFVEKDKSPKEAGGFIIQMLPGASDSLADALQERVQNLPPLTKLLAEGKTPEDILAEIFADYDYTINEKIEIKYNCNCSRQRVQKALTTLGTDELKDILRKDRKASLHCHFCGKDYEFSEDQLIEIISAIS